MNNGESSYRRFLEGDTSAFEDIMREHRDGLTFFINRYVRDENAAEDICIDVFCELLTHPRRYNGKSSLKTYIFTIGRSRAIDYLRRKNRVKMLPLDSAESIGDGEPSLEDAVCSDERRRKVNDAISMLPEDMRLAVHLVYFEDMSYSEAAMVLRFSQKQVDNLLYNARKKLGTILRKDELI